MSAVLARVSVLGAAAAPALLTHRGLAAEARAGRVRVGEGRVELTSAGRHELARYVEALRGRRVRMTQLELPW